MNNSTRDKLISLVKNLIGFWGDKELSSEEFNKLVSDRLMQFGEIDETLKSETNVLDSVYSTVLLKYNQCVLYDYLSTKQDLSGDLDKNYNNQYDLALAELNQVLSSIYLDLAQVGEAMLFNIAELNFKVHNYKQALFLIENSIKLENGDVSNINKDLRFKKRLKRVFCLEYLFDGEDTCFYDTLYQAICHLIGNKIFKEKENIDYLWAVVDGLGKEFTENSLLSLMYDGDSECLLSWCKTYVDFNNDKDMYTELIHVLSHCLSEYIQFEKSLTCSALKAARWDSVGMDDKDKNRKQFSYFACVHRIAEDLMLRLGGEYISCHATIRMEEGKYLAALDLLKNYIEREDLEEKDKALLYFYYWYFSIIAKNSLNFTECVDLEEEINSFSEKSKEYFEAYSKHDTIARIYYGILSLREELFSALDLFAQGSFYSFEKITSAFEQFQKYSKANIRVHPVIKDEIKILEETYYLLRDCVKMDQCTGLEDEEVGLYYLDAESRLSYFNRNGQGCKLPRQNNKELFMSFGYEIILPMGRFYCISKASIERCFQNLDLSIVDIKPPKKLEFFISSMMPEDITNVLVSIEDTETWEMFVRFYNNYNEKKAKKLNFFVYSSIKLEQTMTKSNVHYYGDLATAIRQCVFYSGLESCIQKLKKPISSYIISPVTEDDTFSSQNVKLNPMLLEDKVGVVMPKINASAYIQNLGMVEEYEEAACKILKGDNNLWKKAKNIIYIQSKKDGVRCFCFDVKQMPIKSNGLLFKYDEAYPFNLWDLISGLYKKCCDQYRAKNASHAQSCRCGNGNGCAMVYGWASKDSSMCGANIATQYNDLVRQMHIQLGVVFDTTSFLLMKCVRSNYFHGECFLAEFGEELSIPEQKKACEQLENLSRCIVDYQRFADIQGEIKSKGSICAKSDSRKLECISEDDIGNAPQKILGMIGNYPGSSNASRLLFGPDDPTSYPYYLSTDEQGGDCDEDRQAVKKANIVRDFYTQLEALLDDVKMDPKAVSKIKEAIKEMARLIYKKA